MPADHDPATAQFLTLDPKVATTLSPYGYVQGDPLNSSDPGGACGLWGKDTCWAVVAAVLDQAAHVVVPGVGDHE